MDKDAKTLNLANKEGDFRNQADKDVVFEETVCNPDFSQGCINGKKSPVENSDKYDD